MCLSDNKIVRKSKMELMILSPPSTPPLNNTNYTVSATVSFPRNLSMKKCTTTPKSERKEMIEEVNSKYSQFY